MKKIVTLLLSVLMLSSCKTTYQSRTAVVQDSIIYRIVDTTHVINNQVFLDSIHMEVTNTTKEKIIEIYDPETGKLSQKVSECISQSKDLYTRLNYQIQENEYLKAKVKELEEAHNSIDTHIEAEGKGFTFDWSTSLMCLVIALNLFWVIKILIRK